MPRLLRGLLLSAGFIACIATTCSDADRDVRLQMGPGEGDVLHVVLGRSSWATIGGVVSGTNGKFVVLASPDPPERNAIECLEPGTAFTVGQAVSGLGTVLLVARPSSDVSMRLGSDADGGDVASNDAGAFVTLLSDDVSFTGSLSLPSGGTTGEVRVVTVAILGTCPDGGRSDGA